MKLRNNHALCSVDDERAIVGHQRNLTEKDFLFLDVANRLDVRVRIFVVNGEANLDLERHAVTHAAFLTLLLIVLMLQADGLAAVRAQFGTHRIERAANVAQSLARTQRIDLDLRAAALTGCAQVLQTFEVAALALPVADLVLDKIQRRRLAK